MTAISEQLRIKWTRWQQAQQYERGFWERLGAGIERGAVGQLDWYKWRAERLEALLDRAGRTPGPPRAHPNRCSRKRRGIGPRLRLRLQRALDRP